MTRSYGIACARLFHETHSFSPIKTDLKKFEQRELYYGKELLKNYKGTKTELGAFFDFIENWDIEGYPILAAAANPAGLVTYEAYESLKNRILRDLEKLDNIDALYLSLHGAMVVEGINDAQGDLLKEVRNIVGDIPVAITLDLHANISKKVIELSDILVGYKTYPHTDQYNCSFQALTYLYKFMKKEIKPVKYYKKLKMMPPSMNMMTNSGPMADIINRAKELEENKEIINISVFGGYPYADVEDVGFTVVVTTDDNIKMAKDLTLHLSDMAWIRRHDFIVKLPSPEEAIKEALNEETGPVVLVDVADNPGSGGFADTTKLLETMLKMKIKNAAFAFISDYQSVEKAIKTGVGNDVELNLGGKISKLYGNPVKIRGTVRTITDGIYYNKGPWNTGIKVNFGRTVVVSTNGIDIIITEGCQSPNDPEIFRRNGIEPCDKKVLALKAKNHFRVGFKDIVKKVIPLDAPGVATLDLKKFPYKSVPRPIFPLDDI